MENLVQYFFQEFFDHIYDRLANLVDSLNDLYERKHDDELDNIVWSREKNDLKSQSTKLCRSCYFNKNEMKRLRAIREILENLAVAHLLL